MTAAVSFAAAAVLCALAAALGARVLKLLGLEVSSPAEEAALALPLGIAAVSHAILGLGLVGELRPVPVAAALVALAAAAWPAWRAPLRWLRALGARWGDGVPYGRASRTAGLCIAAVGLVAALAPPSGEDAVRYHLAAPAMYVAEGAIRFKPFLHFAQPMALEMLGAAGMLAGGETAELFVHLFAGVASAAALWALCAAMGAGTAAPLALLLYFGAPLNLSEGISHCQDYGLMLGAFGALLAWRRWRDGANGPWLFVAGAAAGLGAACKYTGLYAVAAVFLLAAARRRPGAPWQYLAGVFAVAGPWYAKNALQAGNPFWPAFYGWLGGEGWNATAATLLAGEIDAHYAPLGHGAGGFLLGPFALAGAPQLFFENSGGLGVATSALAPLALALGWKRLREHAPLFAFAAVVYAAWFPFAQNGRFLWPAWAILGVVAAEGALAASARSRIVRALVAGAIAFHLAVSAVLAFTVLERSSVALLGIVDREEYLRRAVVNHDAVRWLNEHAPLDANVAATPERLLHLKRRYFWVGPYSGVIDRGGIEGWEEFLLRVRAAGATHLLVSGAAADAEALEAAGAEVVYRSPAPLFRDYEIFWMQPEPSAIYAFSSIPRARR